jgi:hypothetical protein
MDLKWRTVSVVAGLPMLVGVAACGGGSSAVANVPAPSPTATVATSSTPEPTVTASAGPSASGSTAPTTIPVGMVRITFTAANCEGCRFTGTDTFARPNPISYVSSYVYNGKATVLVPISATHDMSFRADYSEPIGIGGAHPDLALGYPGVKDGTELEWETVQTKEQGNYCWAGTTSSEVSIHVIHKVFTDPKAKPDPKNIVFWASPTLPVDPDRYRQAFKGGMGDQDFPWCDRD